MNRGEYMNNLNVILEKWKVNPSTEIKEEIKNIDKNITKDYLEELKQYITPKSDIKEEEQRLNKIVSILSNRLEQREELNNKLKEYSIEVNLIDIPNIDKLDNFRKKLEIIRKDINKKEINTDSKIKLLNSYYDIKLNFPTLLIPSMGLEQVNDNINIDANSLFIN
jgi:hypothetical protein